MLNVKKKILSTKNKFQNEDVTQLHEEIKNSVKNLYLSDQKKKKTINEYDEILSKIRNEYALLQEENNQLKIQLQKYQNYVQNLLQKKYQKPIRKRKHYYDDQEESEESDSYVTEIRRRRPNKQRKRIIYEDEIDGLPEYEPHSVTEDEEQEEEQDKIQTKSKKRLPLPKLIEKSKQLRKGITKLIKNFCNFFCIFISCNLNVIAR